MDDSKPFKATQNHNTEKVTTLLENKLLTLVVFNFQHWFSTDVEITDVNIINVNIGFQKIDVNIHYTTSIFMKTDVVSKKYTKKSKNYKN